MRLVFLGTPSTAVPSLEALAAAGHEIALVVTRPDRLAGRSLRHRPPPVKDAATRLGLSLLQPEGVRSAHVLERFRAARPDVLVVVAFGRILPAPLLEAAPHGAVNVHFSLLPKYRGAAPVQWALARGEARTGVTTMRMNERLDEGDVLLERAIDVAPAEHAPALAERLAGLGAELVVSTLEGLAEGSLRGVPQDPAAASYAPRLTRADGAIDPALSAIEIEGRIRGFDPWPGVWVGVRGRRLRLVAGAASAGGASAAAGVAPGTVIECSDQVLLVAAGGGSVLAVSRLQPEGRDTMSARDAVNGRHLVVGDRLEPLGRPT